MSGVCFVDTETTGLDPDRHEIWEVGLITPDGGEWDWQLDVDLSRADPIALNIGRFHERRFQSALPYRNEIEVSGGNRRSHEQFAEEFVALTRGLHLAGAVVSFDAERLWRLLRAHGQCPMWHYHLIDVEALTVGYLARKVHENAEAGFDDSLRPTLPWKSEDLSRAVGVDPDRFDRHTALGDARWAKAIYEAVMA